MVVFVVLLLALLIPIYLGSYRDIPVAQLEPTYATGASKFVMIDGTRVHYRDEGRGPVLLLLHGTSSSLHNFDGWVPHLQDHYRVVRLDLPGFGLTGPTATEDYRITYYVAFLKRFAETLQLPRFTLLGHSLGGLIAWEYAYRHPESLEKLILVAPAGYPREHTLLAFRLASMSPFNRILEVLTPKYFVRLNALQAFADPALVTDRMVGYYHDMALREGNRRALGKVLKANDPDVSVAHVRKIIVPTLVLWGEQDKIVPFSHSALFQADLPKSQAIAYAGIGHSPLEEAPARTAEDVMTFLSER